VSTPTSASAVSLPFAVRWVAANPASARYSVRYQFRNGTSWALTTPVTWLSKTASTSGSFGAGGAPVTVRPGITYYLGAITHDGYGNTSAWSPAATAAVPLDQTAATYSTGWTAIAATGRWLGSVHSSTVNGSKATLVAPARQFQIIGDKCAACGSFKVYIDGVYKGTVSSYATTTQVRRVLWTSPALGPITRRTLVVVPALTTSRRVNIDGFVPLR
jgi:hypothetical protein